MNFKFSFRKEPRSKDVAVNDHGLNIHEKASRDWKIILFSFITLSILVAVCCGYLLWRVSNGESFSTVVGTTDSTLTTNRKILIDVVKVFEDRKSSFESFKQTPPAEIDPSL